MRAVAGNGGCRTDCIGTAAIADRVLVPRSGVVIEDGSPAEPMRAGDGEHADPHARRAASLA